MSALEHKMKGNSFVTLDKFMIFFKWLNIYILCYKKDGNNTYDL